MSFLLWLPSISSYRLWTQILLLTGSKKSTLWLIKHCRNVRVDHKLIIPSLRANSLIDRKQRTKKRALGSFWVSSAISISGMSNSMPRGQSMTWAHLPAPGQTSRVMNPHDSTKYSLFPLFTSFMTTCLAKRLSGIKQAARPSKQTLTSSKGHNTTN